MQILWLKLCLMTWTNPTRWSFQKFTPPPNNNENASELQSGV